MNNKEYDNYKLIIQEQPNFNLVAVVEYYKEGKLVDRKRSSNQNFIKKLIDQATIDMRKIKMIGNNLIINGNFEGHIIIKNYQEIRNRRDFWDLNKKVKRKLSKKEVNELIGIKNIKVTRNTEKIKKIKLKKNKFLKPVTLALIIASQIALINKNLPDFKLSFDKTTESTIETDEEYNDTINIKNIVMTSEKKYSTGNLQNNVVNVLTQENKNISETIQNIDSAVENKVIDNNKNYILNNENNYQDSENSNIIVDSTDENGGQDDIKYPETIVSEINNEDVNDIIHIEPTIEKENSETIESNIGIKDKKQDSKTEEEFADDSKIANTFTEVQPIILSVSKNTEVVESSIDANIEIKSDDISNEVETKQSENVTNLEEKEIDNNESEKLIEDINIDEETTEIAKSENNDNENIVEETPNSTVYDEESNSLEEFNDYYSTVPTYQAISYDNVLTEQEFNQLVAMVESEAGGTNPQDHYTDALAVTSTVLNRLEDKKWRASCGNTIMEQVHASDQFVGIQRDVYKQIINNPENASPEVVQAVKDCLSGTRNNPYLSFRAKENKSQGRMQFVEDGNNYFGLPEMTEAQNNIDEFQTSNLK